MCLRRLLFAQVLSEVLTDLHHELRQLLRRCLGEHQVLGGLPYGAEHADVRHVGQYHQDWEEEEGQNAFPRLHHVLGACA